MSPLPDNRPWDLETDLLVIGAGAAGMTAALVGALEGLKTILCEKSGMVGGTTATSAGTVWIPGSRQSKAAGVPDTIAAAKSYLAAILGADADDARIAAYLATGPAVLDYLEQKTELKFIPPPVHPDYLQLAGAAVGGRALGVVAVRWPQARCGFCARKTAAPGISRAGRHDGRQIRHSIAAAPVSLLGKFRERDPPAGAAGA